jgi:hypothetical protein
MKKLLLLFFVFTTNFSYTRGQTSSVDEIYHREFYDVLNDLIRIRLTNISVIYCQTKPVYKTMWGNIPKPNFDTLNPPPPPPVGFIYYDTSSFNYYIRWSGLDLSDANFMFKSIDSTKTFSIDSSKIIIPVLSKEKFLDLFKEKDIYEGYKEIRSIYGSSCFIAVSTPVFNKDFTKVLISIDYQCGPTWGQGYEFLLEKKNGKWWLVEDKGTWVS